MEILFMEPVFKQMVWGGDKLKREWHYEAATDNTGECWGISAHPHGDCKVRNGQFAGMHLSELWQKAPELFGGSDGENIGESFPLLVKILDAKADLSLQVHPDDAYAASREDGSRGKAEGWYVLDAEENAALLLGHNAGTKEELIVQIQEGRWADFIREVPVKKGDFIQIEPGCVHAIKGGLQILETEQNSDITYRIYDYDRLVDGKPRELHLEKALDVITVPAATPQECISHVENVPVNTKNMLIACDFYKVWKIDVKGSMTFIQDEKFMLASVVSGNGTLNGEEIKKGDHFILPYGFGEVKLAGDMELIVSAAVESDRK